MVQFPQRRRRRPRVLEGFLESRERLRRASEVEQRPSEVEECETVVRAFAEIQLKEAQIPVKFALACGRVLIADMIDDDVGPAHAAADAVDRRQDLLVNAIVPSNLRQIAE